ncbi:MAG: hypothetical protein EXR77_08245 [Myxococcales bacterium]|nr:hypothetical protein [Myxococcales bacterium]
MICIRRAALAAVAGVLSAAGASVAAAAVPATVAVHGALLAVGSGPAADGNYIALFRLYDKEVGGTAAWFEGPLDLMVKNGQFHYVLGSKTPLSPATLAAMPQVWLGVQVGLDPELPRVPLHSTVFAIRAGMADGLECSACVSAQHLDGKALAGYAKTSDLGAALQNYAQKADLQAYAQVSSLAAVAASGAYGDLKGAPKADVGFTGMYSDLLGLPVLAKVGSACGTGLVVKGIKADGSLDCISASLLAKDLPADGLDEVSNGLLTTQFAEVTTSATTPVKIADFAGAGVSDLLTVPDFGLAQGLACSATITNSDVSKVRVDLYDPTGAKTTVYNGESAGTKLELTLKSPANAALNAWVGKNPKGLWSLVVADLAKGSAATDGNLEKWSIAVSTLSDKKVQANGAFIFNNAKSAPIACTDSTFGASYANPIDKALYICNGKDWAPFYLTVPGSAENPGASCADLKTKVPLAKDGPYWLNPAGSGAFLGWCDMTFDGGGWTLAMRMANNGTLGYASGYWTDKNLLNEAPGGSVDPTLNNNAKLGSYNTLVGTSLRGCKGSAGSTNCVQQDLGGAKTLQTVFNENFKGGGPSRGTLTALWGDDGSQPHCNTTGINNFSTYGGGGTYSGARFGLVGNNENDCATTDSGWGFGVYSCSNPSGKACGAGAAMWQSGTCGLNCTQGTLWVR